MFFCECLNIVGSVAPSNGIAVRNSLKLSAAPAIGDNDGYEAYEFFKSALGPVEGTFHEQHEALVIRRKVENWTTNQCINCDSYVYAAGEDGTLLVNANLMRDKAQLMKKTKCDKYSLPFKIILKPIDSLPTALHLSINDNVRVKSMFDKLQDFIDHDSIQTEAEIRRLNAEKIQRRQKAERDFQRIVFIIESTSTVASTKSLSNENIGSLTPPVTPESVNEKMMSIDNPLPQPMKVGNSNKMKQRDGFAKHSNAINQQHITRTINFEEDIFEIDGMEDEAKNETDHYHKYSDTEDGSDGERPVEKRPHNRGRSGSINIARSAPISMPQFAHHALQIIDDDKADNEQPMDIASSIQMLARSIQVDSVFGELPGRPVMRYKTEF